jgi:hypothetical protein
MALLALGLMSHQSAAAGTIQHHDAAYVKFGAAKPLERHIGVLLALVPPLVAGPAET